MSTSVTRLAWSLCVVFAGMHSHAQVSSAPAALQIPRVSESPLAEASDPFHLRAVADPKLSPAGDTALFTVQYSDRVGRPYTRIWRADLASGQVAPWGSAEGVQGGSPRWSPDGRSVAYREGGAIVVAAADGSS